VPVPTGRGWTAPTEWVYERHDRFVLKAELRTGSQIAATVHYQYLLAAEGIDPADFLKKTAIAANLRIARSGRIADGIEIDWVQLYPARGVADTVRGAARLPHGRALIIEVRAPGDHLLAARLFKTLAPEIVFAPPEQIARGADFIGRLKASGLTQIVQDHGGFENETAFFIGDTFDQPRGFQIVQFRKNADTRNWGVLKGERTRYIVGTRGGLSRGYFECSDTFDRYIWHTRRSRLRRGGGAASEVELAADGTLRISGGSLPQDVLCRPASAVPEILIGEAALACLNAPDDEVIIVTVVFEEGDIVPAMVATVDCSRDEENTWAAVDCVQFEFLHAADSQTKFYFDPAGRLVGRIDDKQRVQIWDPCDRPRLVEAFGDLNRYLGAESIND